MQERKDESQIYNYQRIQLSNDKFINGILAGMLDLTWLQILFLILPFICISVGCVRK